MNIIVKNSCLVGNCNGGENMKIRQYENLVLFFDTCWGFILIVSTSLGYFFGFTINKTTLIYYFITLISIILVLILIYLVYLLFCKTFILFTDHGIIKIKGYHTTLIVKYSEIRMYEYYNVFHLLIGDPKGGNLVLGYSNQKDNNLTYLYIPICKRKLKKIEAFKYL